LIVLDTQPLSQLQRAGSRDAERRSGRLQSVPFEDVRITVISPYEQFRACLGRIHSSHTPSELLRWFGLFSGLLDHYGRLWTGRILPFDGAASAIYGQFDAKLVRKIGARDARIAAMAHDATLLTANRGDFGQIPGLRIEDWLASNSNSEP
jgi:tRNA(fMet)-specific endonuclease VapC